MLFVENIKAFKIKVKYIKTVGQDVLSIGFPISSFNAQSNNN